MNDQFNNQQPTDFNQTEFVGKQELAKAFMSNVFTYMTVALAITGITAFLTANFVMSSESFFNLLYNTPMRWVVMFAPLGFVILMNSRFSKMSAQSLLLLYLVFATLMGVSLSSIFIVFELGTIASTFFITAGTFGAMAILGWTTNTDLTKFGSILYMALIGLIIASVVNWFMGSEMIDFLISGAGVLIFTGLTAYDVQKLKRIGQGIEYGNGQASKLAIMGAVSLYLDFINLFLFLLRIFGRD